VSLGGLGPCFEALGVLYVVTRNLDKFFEAFVKKARDFAPSSRSGNWGRGGRSGLFADLCDLVEAIDNNPTGHVGKYNVVILGKVFTKGSFSTSVWFIQEQK
jgi:hypothetical protein